MTVLEQVYASGGDVVIETLELSCSAWDAPLYICNGFENHLCRLETGEWVTFLAAAIQVALPKKSSQGDQVLTFALDNLTGEAQRLIDQALEAEARVTIVYRPFLASDKTQPADNPYRMVVRSGTMQGTAVQVNAGFFDLINTAWPRDLYTAEFAPGLKYL